MNKKVFKLLVEGNIGSGKSTFINYVASSSNLLRDISQIFPEPIHLWQNLKGFNLLKMFNDSPKRYGFPFESYVILTMIDHHQKTVEKEKSVKIMERSIYSAKYCFIETLSQNKVISEPESVILDLWFDYLVSSENYFDIDLIVYMKCNPEINRERIIRRGREEEKNTSIEYLKALNDKYELWLDREYSQEPRAPIVTINTCADLDKTLSEFDWGISKITEYYSTWSSRT